MARTELDEGAQAIRRALQGVQLFSDVLSSDQLDRLAEQCEASFFSAGATLMRQGERDASMFCITEGTVSISITDGANRRVDLRTLSSGTIVGELEILSGEPRTATVTAVTDVRALEITKPVLEDALARSPELVQSFVAVGAIRREMLDQVLGRPGRSVWARFAETIRRRLLPG